MRISRRSFSWAGALACVGALPSAEGAEYSPPQEARTVHIRGSVSFARIVQLLAEQYMKLHPSTSVVVSGGGTSRGYLTLLDGTADIAMVSGGPSDAAEAEVARSGLKLVDVPFRRVALAPAVHHANPVNDLSVVQLREIFTGRIANWREVGGRNAPITVYIGPPEDGITNAWSDEVLGDTETFTPRARNADLDHRIAALRGDPTGITYLDTLSLGDRAVKLLSVDKALAGADSVHRGAYPLMAPLKFVTRERSSSQTRKFLDFVATEPVAASNSVFPMAAAR